MRTNWKRLGSGAISGLALVLFGCASSPVEPQAVAPHHQECECGTPEHDVLGCTHECCRGGPSCGNPLCLCPTMVRGAAKGPQGEKR